MDTRIQYVNHLKFPFPLTFSAKTLWVPAIVKFLPKTLWVPGPRGPGVPHPMFRSEYFLKGNIQYSNTFYFKSIQNTFINRTGLKYFNYSN